MVTSLLPEPVQSYVDENGKPLSNGKLFTYAAGTTTNKATYQDAAGTIANLNPIILNGRGEATIYGSGNYRFILQNSAGTTIWDRDNIVSPDTFELDVLAKLADTMDVALGDALVGVKQPFAGASGRTQHDRNAEFLSAGDFGARGNGTTDDQPALAAANAAGVGFVLSRGIYRIGSNLSLSTPVVFSPGAVLKPDAGVTVTFGQNFVAGTSYQIFDLGNAGAFVSLPYNLSEAWAEWWGAKGDLVKTDNEVPINQALAAVGATASGGTGVAYGTVNLGRGWFLTSSVISIGNYTSLRGFSKGYTVIKANAGTWSGNAMFKAVNGTLPMFDSRIENIRIEASQLSAITYVVYTASWQESCGLRNCLIKGFQNIGMFYEVGYGGAALMTISDCEIFPDDASIGSTGIYLTNTATQNWMNFALERTTIGTGAAVPASITGIRVDNRISLVVNSVHVEGVTNGLSLSGAGSVSGAGLTGGPQVTNVFNCMSGWTGAIDVSLARQGSATNMLADSARSYAIAAVEPVNGHVQWPPSGMRAIAMAMINADGTIAHAEGLYGPGVDLVIKGGAGIYDCRLSPSMDAPGRYAVLVTLQGTQVGNYVVKTSGTMFRVVTINGANTAVDCAFVAQVFHTN